MTETEKPDQVFFKAAQVFLKAGQMPIDPTDTLAQMIEALLTKEQAEFLTIFRKKSYTIDQIKARAKGLSDEKIQEMLKGLIKVAAITPIPNKRLNQVIYYVSPLMPGMLEFEFMKGLTTEKHKRLARLHEKFFEEMKEKTQQGYDKMVTLMREAAPAIARTVPVEEKIAKADDVVMPFEEVSKLVNEAEFIAVGNCYCRHGKDLLDDPCKKTDMRRNCFLFGRTARNLHEQGFVEPISKEDALKLFKKSEEDGLVHHVVHRGLDPYREVESICNCCKCCCGIFGMYLNGISPLVDITTHIARVDAEECVGCGTCEIRCNIEAIEVIDDKAVVDEDVCIGCGVCVITCPSEALSLERTPMRKVFVPPRKFED